MHYLESMTYKEVDNSMLSHMVEIGLDIWRMEGEDAYHRPLEIVLDAQNHFPSLSAQRPYHELAAVYQLLVISYLFSDDEITSGEAAISEFKRMAEKAISFQSEHADYYLREAFVNASFSYIREEKFQKAVEVLELAQSYMKIPSTLNADLDRARILMKY